MKRRIVITTGEPAGIGPDLILQIAQKNFPVEFIVIADPNLLRTRAQLLNLPINIIECNDHFFDEALQKPHALNTLYVYPLALKTESVPGKLNKKNAAYVVETLKLAADFCMQQKADAIVTGPVHKEIINDSGIPFSGHTEFFAQCANVPHTVMLFVVDQLRVALATTHLPLAKVSSTITQTLLQHTLSILQQGLQKQFGIAKPRIAVCGLNPHAGEGGYLGREEIETITPALNQLRAQGYDLHGPYAADTIFLPAQAQDYDAILAMYHDQALPVIKYAGFERAVNVTLGLPFIRTSVDHGTALPLAGTGQAQAGSLEAALRLAMAVR